MFKHLLLPTDGSAQSEATIQKAIEFAKGINAKVSGFHVIPASPVTAYLNAMMDDTRREYEQQLIAEAEKYLAVIEKAAKDAGVVADTAYVMSDHPYAAIIEAAEQKGCDLIVMASHGRRGVKAIVLGSETHKVLVHSQIPVLVYR
jgi:nucleotide-binding universal stress UspA family protein